MKRFDGRELRLEQKQGIAVATGMLTLILIVTAAHPLFGKENSHQKKSPFTYRRVILTEPATYRRENICIPFAGSLTSGDFFEGLRPNDSATGRKFFKGSTEVKEFPEELTIEICAIVQSFPLIAILVKVNRIAKVQDRNGPRA